MTQRSVLVGRSYLALCRDLGLRHQDVLRHAGLAESQFLQDQSRVSLEEYLQFWRSLEAIAQDPHLALSIANRMQLVPFDPCIFAALCSPDLARGARRIAMYKRLIGPLRMEVTQDAEGLHIGVAWTEECVNVPQALNAAALIYLVRIAREATRTALCPLRVVAPQPLEPEAAYKVFFGVAPKIGRRPELLFSTEDAHRPFLTANKALWTSFEPELQRQLSKLDKAMPLVARLRSMLLESLPSGETSVEIIARRLGLSARTLQRRLRSEGHAFKDVVRATRGKLATHYLQYTALGDAEIAFLLGFEEPSSFFRALRHWTGRTPGQLRTQFRNQSAGSNPGA